MDQPLGAYTELTLMPSDVTPLQDGPVFSYTLMGLQADTYYQVMVIYTTEMGTSPPHDAFIIKTAPAIGTMLHFCLSSQYRLSKSTRRPVTDSFLFISEIAKKMLIEGDLCSLKYINIHMYILLA